MFFVTNVPPSEAAASVEGVIFWEWRHVDGDARGGSSVVVSHLPWIEGWFCGHCRLGVSVHVIHRHVGGHLCGY